MDILLSSVSQGLLWSIMAIGVYITFRLLDIPDLTATEGSFPLGEWYESFFSNLFRNARRTCYRGGFWYIAYKDENSGIVNRDQT